MHHVLLGRVIDGYSDHPLDKGCVVWQDDRIVYVGPVSAYRIPEHSEILDMHGGTILPGFIDAHAHLTGEEDAVAVENPYYRLKFDLNSDVVFAEL